jgi:hypothetical protein
MPNQVFISYSWADSDLVGALAKAFDTAQVPYFLDKKDVRWGDELRVKISVGLAESSDLLVVLSPASIKSQWVPYEIGQAVALKKRVLPFLTHPSLDVPPFLREFRFETDIERVVLFFAGGVDERTRSSTGAHLHVSPKEAEELVRAPAIRTRNWKDLEQAASNGIRNGQSETEVKAILRSRGVTEHDAEKIVREVSLEDIRRRTRE